jgi:hypothetical protein
MAELPGWDRTRLGTAATADVEAARMLVYARVLEPTITEPYDAHLEVLEIESIDNAKVREQKAKHHTARRKKALQAAIRDQKRHRLLLGLDEPDDDEEEDA